MKKLIKLNSQGRFTEIDTIKLVRTAKALHDFIVENIPKNNDPFNIWGSVMPLCQDALDGLINVTIPFGDLPLNYVLSEGLLTIPNFEALYSHFSVAITGSPLKQLDKIEIKGELYAYADFED